MKIVSNIVPATPWTAAWSHITAANPLTEYWRDAWERSVLVLDTFRQRGNAYIERTEETAPNVLSFEAEVIADGRTLPQPVNYLLMRILPLAGVSIDPKKRPFIVFDPRAGHGPGIGGMKHDSEIGVAMANGHPCYFVGFLPAPMPGQTVGKVCIAEAHFIETVIARHPEAGGKPVLIGNCQAGWQIMMMASMRPDLTGPIMLAGSPLSYWAGVRGKNPLRYLGGLLGGTWLTALAGDLGNGIFDGAALVGNFESMHPSNTYWKKNYDLYSKVDTEAPRFLEFEKWWGNPVLLNAEEMQDIADKLFVGNQLTSGELATRQGIRVDLRNIRAPIIVFCSWGDDITPPQQALHWILDLYEHDHEIEAAGQTIVYCLHQSIGHLGIFVSGKVATKEHGEFAHAMDLIDLAPPGLYEAVISGVDETTEHRDLVNGDYLFQLRRRSLGELRALIGGNGPEDDLRFATAARVSEVNLSLYRATLAPMLRSLSSKESAEFLRAVHPNRLRFGMFSDRNPLMRPVAAAAEAVRADRHPVAETNPLIAMERHVSDVIVQTLDVWTHMRDAMTEAFFLGVYGSPLVQSLAGLGTEAPLAHRRIARDLSRESAEAHALHELARKITEGGLAEAGVRAAIYVRMSGEMIDERVLPVLREIAAEPGWPKLGFTRLKQIVRDQHQMLKMNEEKTISALPRLLPEDRAERAHMLEFVRRVVTARGTLSSDEATRLARVETLFDVGTPSSRRAATRAPELTHG